MQEKNDIRFSISNKEQFSFRSALLLIHDKSILLERDQGNGDLEVYVPGGAVQFSETAEQAISREMREELGVKLISPEFAGILESFWSRGAISYHQLTMVFRQQVDEMLFSDLDHSNYRDLDVSAQAKNGMAFIGGGCSSNATQGTAEFCIVWLAASPRDRN
ncbi:NUDIX domain-containing protein [Schleiferilactobacillus harbinensis]|uniref:NUDIX domain-containing protein n=1 Tax=Schleiferilactobacillus harbinensis TaxID=304207 RepID=A0A5P8M100_9LACO|nr:NUDIX domain-containing protein [Schleiferilactobacillus harbinensis]QFR21965.1 NUDIX domain-containing protein [Schleiferilactobacillus harbinensis]